MPRKVDGVLNLDPIATLVAQLATIVKQLGKLNTIQTNIFCDHYAKNMLVLILKWRISLLNHMSNKLLTYPIFNIKIILIQTRTISVGEIDQTILKRYFLQVHEFVQEIKYSREQTSNRCRTHRKIVIFYENINRC